MTIKKLVQPAPLPKTAVQPSQMLNSSDSIYHAFSRLLKMKQDALAVYEEDKFIGMLSMTTLAQTFLSDFNTEREQRYELIVTMNSSLTKLSTLLGKIEISRTASAKIQGLEECRKTIAIVKELIKY